MSSPETTEELVRWFLQTLHTTPHGEVGIHAVVQDGRVVQTRCILNATTRPSAVPGQKWGEVDKVRGPRAEG